MFKIFLSFLAKIGFLTGLIGDKNSFLKPLSAEEEERCLAAYRAGDMKARETLVKHNMRLVAHVAKKYRGAADQDDLTSVGSMGLIKALDNFQPGRGTTFSTFAARCIENEMLMLIRANKKHKNTLSLSDPVGLDKDGNELTLLDVLAEKEDDVFEHAERAVVRERLLKIVRKTLSERECEVLCMRYALGGGVPRAQREVAEKLNISRSYVSRIEKRAIGKLKKVLSAADFYDEEG